MVSGSDSWIGSQVVNLPSQTPSLPGFVFEQSREVCMVLVEMAPSQHVD